MLGATKDDWDRFNRLCYVTEQNHQLLTKIWHVLRPTRINIVFSSKGKILPMPVSLTDIQSVSASIDEADAAGNPVPVSDPTALAWTVSDATVVGLTVNTDGSVVLKGLKVGTSQVAVTDPANGLSAQDTITVTADVATALVIKFGTPS